MATQKARLLDALREAGQNGLSTWEITTSLRILNSTGRISDLRADGYEIDAQQQREGHWVYRIVDRHPRQYVCPHGCRAGQVGVEKIGLDPRYALGRCLYHGKVTLTLET